MICKQNSKNQNLSGFKANKVKSIRRCYSKLEVVQQTGGVILSSPEARYKQRPNTSAPQQSKHTSHKSKITKSTFREHPDKSNYVLQPLLLRSRRSSQHLPFILFGLSPFVGSYGVVTYWHRLGEFGVLQADSLGLVGNFNILGHNRDVRTGKKVSAFRPSDFDTFPDSLSALKS